MMPKRLALVNIGDMHLQYREGPGFQRIEKGHGGMGESRRIDNDSRRVLTRFMDPVDQLVFPIGLVEADSKVQRHPNPSTRGLDIRQRLAAVNLGLALS